MDESLLDSTGSATVLISEQIESYLSRDEAVSDLAEEGWDIDKVVFDVNTDSDSLRSVAVNFGHPYEGGKKILRVIFIMITLTFIALSGKVLLPVFGNTQPKKTAAQGGDTNRLPDEPRK